MITRASEYNWISGDFNVSEGYPLINGGIMPLRTGTSATTGVENSKILRGEDVCFLAEAAKERNYCFNGSVLHERYAPQTVSISEEAFPFDKKLSSLQMQSVVGLYSDLFSRRHSDSLTTFFIKKSALHDIRESELDFSSRFSTMIGAAQVSPGDQTAAASDFNSGSPLLQTPVRNIFNDLGVLDNPALSSVPLLNASTGRKAEEIGAAHDVSGDYVEYVVDNHCDYGGSVRDGQYFWIPDYVAADIPDTYFSAAEVWGGYHVVLYRGYAHPTTVACDSVFTKLGDMTRANGRYTWTFSLDQIKAIMSEELSRKGESLASHSDVRYGSWFIVRMFRIARLYVVATLSNRTRW